MPLPPDRPPAQPGIAANGPWQLRYGVGSGLWSAVGVLSFLPAAPCQRVDLDRSRIEGDAGRRRKGGRVSLNGFPPSLRNTFTPASPKAVALDRSEMTLDDGVEISKTDLTKKRGN